MEFKDESMKEENNSSPPWKYYSKLKWKPRKQAKNSPESLVGLSKNKVKSTCTVQKKQTNRGFNKKIRLFFWTNNPLTEKPRSSES